MKNDSYLADKEGTLHVHSNSSLILTVPLAILPAIIAVRYYTLWLPCAALNYHLCLPRFPAYRRL
jgi:hypothetical protein